MENAIVKVGSLEKLVKREVVITIVVTVGNVLMKKESVNVKKVILGHYVNTKVVQMIAVELDIA